MDSPLTTLQQAQIAHSEAAERCHAAALYLQQAQQEMQQAHEAERKAASRVANLRAVAAQQEVSSEAASGYSTPPFDPFAGMVSGGNTDPAPPAEAPPTPPAADRGRSTSCATSGNGFAADSDIGRLPRNRTPTSSTSRWRSDGPKATRGLSSRTSGSGQRPSPLTILGLEPST